MTIFFVGIGLMAIGAVLAYAGARVHRATIRGPEDQFYSWFLEVVKKAFAVLTSDTATGGERIAAFGSILLGLGVLTSVVGLIAWAR